MRSGRLGQQQVGASPIFSWRALSWELLLLSASVFPLGFENSHLHGGRTQRTNPLVTVASGGRELSLTCEALIPTGLNDWGGGEARRLQPQAQSTA